MVLALPLVAAGVLAMVGPTDDGPTLCPFALLTGTACPGCGMTRAASHLLRGDLGTALTYHPLIPLAAVAVVAGWAWFQLRLAGRMRPMSQRALNALLSGSAVLMLAVWAIRLASGTLPPV